MVPLLLLASAPGKPWQVRGRRGREEQHEVKEQASYKGFRKLQKVPQVVKWVLQIWTEVWISENSPVSYAIYYIAYPFIKPVLCIYECQNETIFFSLKTRPIRPTMRPNDDEMIV